MSSSDGRRAAGEAAADAEPDTGAAAAGSQHGAADGAEPDPWFDPGPKVPAPAEPPDTAVAGDAADTADSPDSAAESAALAEWFLPTGRAGLLPDSMTVSTDENESGTSAAAGHRPPIQAAGAPPWPSEVSAFAAGLPPPWENGPWPGPGADRPSRAAGGAASGGPASAGRAPGGPASGVPWPPASRPQAPGPWPARTVLVAGLVPLVIPGLVAGALGVRRSKPGELVRRASILAIAASLAWAVIIIVLVASISAGSAGNCIYPAAVHQAYARVMADLRSNAPASSQAADLGLAATRANASAAATATGQIPVRSALFAMAADLQQARADVIANRGVPASLRAHLAADGNALTASCPP